jgi:hypothetical protein
MHIPVVAVPCNPVLEPARQRTLVEPSMLLGMHILVLAPVLLEALGKYNWHWFLLHMPVEALQDADSLVDIQTLSLL